MGLARRLAWLTLACLLARLLTLPDYVQNADGFFFIQGVERYSVAETRPHPPGYPVYIWAGKLAALVGRDPTSGLRAVSVLASTLTLWPLALVAAFWRRAVGGDPAEAADAGLAAALLWTLSPAAWLVGTEIFSDPLGLLLASLLLLACVRAQDAADATAWLGLAGLAAGLMLGARLVYVALLGPLAVAAWRRRGERGPITAAAWGLALTVGAWLGWQFWEDGTRLIGANLLHTSGHFDVPQTFFTDSHPWQRPWRLLHALLVHGLGAAWPGLAAWRWPATAAWTALLGLAALRAWQGRSSGSRTGTLLVAFVLPYAACIVLFFDVGFPRYLLPLTAGACVLAGLGLGGPTWVRRLALLGLASALGSVSVPLARAHARQPPLSSQLARYFAARPEGRPVLLVSVAEAYGLRLYLSAEARAVETIVSDGDMASVAAQQSGAGRQVLTTSPSGDRLDRWQPLLHFCRDPLLDPRGPFELLLFRYDAAGGAPASIPPCR